ncbi:MAG: glucose-1-phosphate thymidylyltransferase [Chlorobi bacterium]|nr:glucose-1-phosphate thymidylyltransferase [Chlorobiota bacterium]
MNIILFDGVERENLLPLTFTRPVAALRVGILTIKEKWELSLKTSASFLTKNYLRKKFPCKTDKRNYMINGSVFPDKSLISEIKKLETGELLIKNNEPIAACLKDFRVENINFEHFDDFKIIQSESDFFQIKFPWDIFSLNGQEIENDFKLITKGRKSQKLSPTVNTNQAGNIFLEDGAKVEFATLIPDNGYIYIGKDAEIMEGSIVKGSFALCEHSVLKIAAKIYGPTTVGPYSKVGGEVNNCVIQGYSNKGHDGFLGNSVIGEWCNLGADTNNSNLKNNYAEVKLWNYTKKGFIKSGLQFCGLIMGDHSKCGINTMFNTGTVVGVSANIFGSGFPRNFIPSFSWGGASGFTTYKLPKVFETAKLVMQRRKIEADETEQAILEEIFKQTEEFRLQY